MNKIHCHRQQNEYYDTYRCEYTPANIFTHRLPVGVILHHYTHRHEKVNHHENEQTHQNYLNDHNVSLNPYPNDRASFSAKRWAAVVVTLLAIALMFRLGLWQLDRMHQKEARLASIAQKQAQGTVSLMDLPAHPVDMQDYPVSLNGRVMDSTQFFLDNQIYEGRVGYHLLAPVITATGTVLVNFGWVSGGQYRGALPDVALPRELTTFSGTVALPALNPVVRETATGYNQNKVLLQQIDIATLNRQTGLRLKPFTVQLEQPSDSQFERDWRPVVMSPKKHLAYAVQWFGLALAACIVALIVFFPRGNSNDKTNLH